MAFVDKLFRRVVALSFASRLSRQEIAGSLGDLGTFIPLAVGMVMVNGLNAGSVLLLAGLFNVATGLLFAIPMPVQPMKAIAAVAMAEKLTPGEIYAAGMVTSAVVLLLGLTGWIHWVERWVPKSVVRGLQLAIGLQLMMLGLTTITGSGHIWGADSIALGAGAGVVTLLLLPNRKVPAALVLFGIGLVAIAVARPEVWRTLHLGLSIPQLTIPTLDEWRLGAVKGAIPQVPLTLLNSVVAVCALSRSLFPNRGASARKVSVSVGLMNIIGCWFGAMPMCHGAGGLAGQYLFGARTGASVVFLGTVKVLLGLFAGGAALALLAVYPQSVLGVLLLFAALELSLVVLDIKERRDGIVMLMTAGAILGLKSTALGFLVGIAIACILFYLTRRLYPDAS